MIPATGNGRIPPERCGKAIGSCRKTRKKDRKMEAVFRPEIVGFFPVAFRPVPAKNSPENGHTSPKDD